MENNNTQHELFKPGWWRNVEVTPSCWYWKGYCTPQGYGRVKTPYPDEKTVIVHRYVYELLVGSIPKGHHLDHMFSTQGCVRNCVNPEHLRPTTAKQNSENRSSVNKDSKTGLRNVHLTARGKYAVKVYSDGKYHYGGTHENIDKASQAAIELRNNLFTHNNVDRIHPLSVPTPLRQPEENKA